MACTKFKAVTMNATHPLLVAPAAAEGFCFGLALAGECDLEGGITSSNFA